MASAFLWPNPPDTRAFVFSHSNNPDTLLPQSLPSAATHHSMSAFATKMAASLPWTVSPETQVFILSQALHIYIIVAATVLIHLAATEKTNSSRDFGRDCHSHSQQTIESKRSWQTTISPSSPPDEYSPRVKSISRTPHLLRIYFLSFLATLTFVSLCITLVLRPRNLASEEETNSRLPATAILALYAVLGVMVSGNALVVFDCVTLYFTDPAAEDDDAVEPSALSLPDSSSGIVLALSRTRTYLLEGTIMLLDLLFGTMLLPLVLAGLPVMLAVGIVHVTETRGRGKRRSGQAEQKDGQGEIRAEEGRWEPDRKDALEGTVGRW